MRHDVYYFDNGATSYPKPKEVIDAWIHYSTSIGASPGRGNYGLSIEGGEKVQCTRERMCDFIGADNAKRLIFTKNATEALNIAIFSLIEDGSHVISTVTEHNAVRRPLNKLIQNNNVEVDFAGVDEEGILHASTIFDLVRPETKTIVVNGISNVTGLEAPIKEIGEFCVENDITFIVDGAQLLGTRPFDINEESVDIIAFTGHKNLLGPTGTGGLYFPIDKEPTPILWGGTGGSSGVACLPDILPVKFEAGTSNAACLYALGEGIRYVMDYGLENVKNHKLQLADYFVEKILPLKKIKLIGPKETPSLRYGVVSVEPTTMTTAEMAKLLWDRYNIAVRGGLHCAPLIHEALDLKYGSLRFSFGLFNTKEQIDYAVASLKDLLSE